MTTWPIIWPAAAEAAKAAAEAGVVQRAEDLAVQTLRMLTLYRVGGAPITVMPCGRTCTSPIFKQDMFLPSPWNPSASDLKSCNCFLNCSCSGIRGVELTGPVGDIIEVRLGGVALAADAYRVENGTQLIRNDGTGWPPCAGPDFTVTYLNAHPVSTLGSYAAGVLAWEWLKSLTANKNCRLSSRVTSVNRQGIQMELAPGLFPDGFTGIEEIDVFIRQWNPNGIKNRPGVYSVDTPAQRQVTWGAF